MGFIRSRVINFFAILAGVLTAAALHGLPWRLDAGLCVAYTVEVLGLALTDRRAQVFRRDQSQSLPRILLTHLGFLVAVVAIARIGLMLIPPPPAAVAGQPREISWGLLLVIGILFALAYGEQKLLFRKPTSGASATPAAISGFEPMAAPASSFSSTAPATPAAPRAPAATLFDKPAAPAPAEPVTVAAPSIAAGLYSAAEADEHEAFIQYMHGKNRAFRKPGVTMKQEYEMWRAHHTAKLNGQALKKPGAFARFLKNGN